MIIFTSLRGMSLFPLQMEILSLVHWPLLSSSSWFQWYRLLLPPEPVFSSHGQFSFPFKLFCGDFVSPSMFAQRFGLDLSLSLWHRPEKTWNNCFAIHVRTSLLDASPTCNRIKIRRHFLEASPEWTTFQQCELCLLPCAGRCLTLQNVDVSWGPRKRRSSRRTLAGNSCFWSEG